MKNQSRFNKLSALQMKPCWLFCMHIFFMAMIAKASPKPERVILFYIDGLHWEAPEKLNLRNFNGLISEGCYVNKSYMIAPHHPTVGEYGKFNSSSFPNPVLQQGTLFISQQNKMIQEQFFPKEKTAFYVNTVAYNSLNRGFTFSITNPSATDEVLTNQAIELIEKEDPKYFRIHLQTPGNEGRYLSYTKPEQPYFRKIFGPDSPYVKYIKEADQHLGRLIESLKKSGKWESTLLIVSSDQGQSKIGWHPVADEDSWCTPLLLRGPGIAKNRKPSYFEHTDLTATICHLMSKDLPTQNGGSGKVDLNLLEGHEDRSVEHPRYILKINQQNVEYARLKALIQLGIEKDMYNSSYLTFLDNDLLTPEPFYHLDRFTEWYKAGSTPHLIESNDKILEQMRSYLK